MTLFRSWWTLLVMMTAAAPLAASSGKPARPATILPNPILFVTQVPIPSDTSTITSAFANHLPTTKACGRGGDLYILYPDGTLNNLTSAAGYGTAGLQDANGIAVREPCVHWSGTRALFSMVLGSPSSQFDSTEFYWQIYEITGFGELETPAITRFANQPQNFNNTNPIYGTDDRIIFSSDRPRNGASHLYPQIDEYRGELSNTGLWSLDPATGDLRLLDHAPSGDFRPIIDSYGRVIFSRWDHLQRDGQADVDVMNGNTYGTFNYSDESAGALILQNDRTEFFPEPQARRTDLLAGTNIIGFEFNHFIPWQINEDGTSGETMNHVGRHDLNAGFGRSFNDDPNLVNFTPSPTRTNQSSIINMVQLAEDPTTPGRYYGVDCIENATHTAGQIITLAGAPSLDAQDMFVTYLTDRSTASFLTENGIPNSTYTGHYRNPLPLSNGALLAVHAGENRADRNMGTYANPVSRYAFRIKTMKIRTGSTLMSDTTISPGISKSVSYWSDGGLVSFSGTMWELDPAEVRARTIPSRLRAGIGSPELQVMAEEGVDTTVLRNYLTQHKLALIVSRDITHRNTDDSQQPYYLKVHNSTKQSPNPSGKVYDVAHLQIFEADYRRGYGLVGGNTTPRPGRRVLATPLNDTSVHNPPNPAGPQGSVLLGADGSMAALIPAHRAISWQLVDSNAVSVVHERFWVTFQPGEIRTCASCHGSNTDAAVPRQIIPQTKPEALRTLLQYWKNNLIAPPPGKFQFSLNDSWNMISVPLSVADGRKTVLFPTALSNAFAYAGSYIHEDTLRHGIGYWVKFGGTQLASVQGNTITGDTIGVTAGWNLIGSIGTSIAVSSLTSSPPGLSTSPFFGYSGGSYSVSDSIQPGRAYWVKTNSAGSLVLSSSSSAGRTGRIRIVLTHEQPPPPPAGAGPVPQEFSLQQNYPNPFNPVTHFRFRVGEFLDGGGGFVSLKVYDVLGRDVATLLSEVKQPGLYQVTWDARNFPSGIYTCRLVGGTFSEAKKLLLIR